ncbi:hypothetical protein [Nocardioides panaciterrulae]|uniref:Uncharacterized protein n=1 Tax=Nocardioides panaciterrulae TaxID=661492 RepID=A0A7Y9E6P5_9ACTN|nr:hypothetical protein [Nocardioides panaciterrulae]NYD42119.1 hypothetical protein [Nocardioides panaciterrulae]
MGRISCAMLALFVLVASMSLEACGSDGAAEPASAAPTTRAPLSPSSTTQRTGDTLPPSSGTSAAEAFTRFAGGGRPAVPWAAAVVYRISGEQVARFGPDVADRPETWDGCPERTTTYEGRDCPVSPLGTIASLSQDGGHVVYSTETPTAVGCNSYRPPAADAGTTVWIRPQEERRDCFSDFAVAVALDGSGRVVSVDLALSGP